MRFFAYALIGASALVVVDGALVALYQPRDRAADEVAPLRLMRAPSVPGEATVLFAGDTGAIEHAAPLLAERGFQYPFTATVDLVRAADLSVANHEAPLSDGGRPFPLYKDFLYRAPAHAAAALAWAGFDVLELANNHATDYGAEGLRDTVANARAAGMVTVGAGVDAAEARRALIVDIGGVRLGLLDYCERKLTWQLWVDQFARRDHPGVAAAVERDLANDVRRLRPAVDVLVVSFHVGANYAPPTAQAIAWSRRAIDLGADLVVNHHPHLWHPVMMYRGRPILLSLGNYAWGTLGPVDYGLLAIAHFARCGLDRVELVPIAVQNERVLFRPQPLAGEELDRVLGQLRASSVRLGAEVTLDGGRGIVRVTCGGGGR
jgi:poly-gamma-glutamate synthesis protein (capsule biosynthesis protein)